MTITHRDRVTPFTTKDTSEIRELLNDATSPLRHQSLAEATLPPGAATQEHYHPRTEEVYYILRGHGTMRLEGEEATVGPGAAIAIPAGQRHKIWNTGTEPLVFLCCCAPPYSHEDTVLTE